MSVRQGDIWHVPYMPREQWASQPFEVWSAVEDTIFEAGYGGKLKDAYRLVNGQDRDDPSDWLTMPTAIAAADLGAPVGQAFTVAVLRTRSEAPR